MLFEVFISVDYSNLATMFARSTGEDASKRMLGRTRSKAGKDTVMYWHENILPGKFDSRQKQYANQPRKQPYSTIKEALANGASITVNGTRITENVQRGGIIDNVRKGVTEKKARAAPIVTSTPARAKLSMVVPRYIVFKRKDGKPHSGKEITKVNNSDYNKLHRVYVKSMVHSLRLFRDRVTKKVS